MGIWRIGAILVLAGAALSVSECATTQRLSAASDVHALLVSIRDDDSKAFDAHVDRRALKGEMETRILQRTQGENDIVKSLGAMLAHPLAEIAGDTMVQPDVFRAVAEYYGYKPETPVPNEVVIASTLRPLPGGRICAAKGPKGPCLITFANEGGTWKLVSFDGDFSLLRLPT